MIRELTDIELDAVGGGGRRHRSGDLNVAFNIIGGRETEGNVVIAQAGGENTVKDFFIINT
jgi:hypothetical protein